MSTVRNSPDELYPRTALCRAYGGEPVQLSALRRLSATSIEVVGGDRDLSVGFPDRDVFEFDGALYGELQRAFAEKNGERLDELWSRALPLAVAAGHR